MLQTLIQIKPSDVPLRVALRNTAAIVLPLGIGIATDNLAVGLGVAAGALNTMFTDQPGPYRLRMRRMLPAALAAAVSAFVGCLVGANMPLLAIAALLWGIGGGLLVALGTDAGRAGMTSMILLVIMSAQPRDPAGALSAASLIFAGGVLQTLFAIAAWPLQRYRPERMAIAETCRQLAASTRRTSQQSQAPPVTQALIDIERLLHGAHRARGPIMETFRVLAELLERMRLELLALGDLRAGFAEGEIDATLGRLLEYAARALDAIADALDRGVSPLAAAAAMEGFEAATTALDQIRVLRADQPALSIAIARAQGLAGQLRAALLSTDFAGSRGEMRAQASEQRLPRALRPRSAAATLRANLRLSSVAFRHALRCGVCLALSVVGARIAGLEHGYWIPMTVAIVLKPDFAGTFRLGLLRVIGTLLGLVLTTALMHTVAFDDPWEQLGLLALLAVGFRMLTTMHYGLAVMMLTGLVVILLAFDGIPPGETMLARGVATVIGSAFALTAYALWPTWERRNVRPALAAMLDAYRIYFDGLFRNDPVAHAAARTAARRSRTNAQASIVRMRDEPRRDAGLLTLADGVFANANRFVRACMSLEAVLQDASVLPAQDRLTAFAARIDSSLTALATALYERSAPVIEKLRESERALAAALREVGGDEADVAQGIIDALDRMTNSIDTVAHLLAEDALPTR